MNLVGRIFVVLIFVMSFAFMGFALVVYSTHTNWKAKADEWKAMYESARKEVNAAKADREELVRVMDEESSSRRREIINLKTKVEELKESNKQHGENLVKLKGELEKAVEMVSLSHTSLEKIRAELNVSRDAFRESQKGWQDIFSQYVAAIDRANDLSNKLVRFRSVGAQLAKDYQDAVDVLRKFGYKPDPTIYTDIPPKGVEGIVTEVRPNGWVEISIGEDSGIIKGHKLDIVRNLGGRSSYVGKIEVVRTEPDRAAAIVLPEYRRGTVQRDDKVEHIDLNEFSAN